MGSGTGTPTTETLVTSNSVNARLYCAVLDVIDAQEIPGVKSVENIMRAIRSASQVLDRRGWFLPVTETRIMDGSGSQTLWIEPLLSVTSIKLDGIALDSDDYVLLPQNRMWEHGPYTSIELVNLGIWSNAVHNNVEIVGQWGLFSSAYDTGAIASQVVGATTLEVSAADMLSPGAIVLLGAEQEVLASYAAPVALSETLANDVDDSAGVLTLTGTEVVSIGEIVRCGVEQMRVEDVNDVTLAVARGWNMTTRSTHTASSEIDVYRKFNVTRGVNGTTPAEHASIAVLRLLPPFDVRYLCTQIAALMHKKGQGGFAGKTGNAELGEVFYNSEFPKDPIKAVMTNYRIVSV